MCHEGNSNSSCQVAADTASCSYTFVKITQNLLELVGDFPPSTPLDYS